MWNHKRNFNFPQDSLSIHFHKFFTKKKIFYKFSFKIQYFVGWTSELWKKLFSRLNFRNKREREDKPWSSGKAWKLWKHTEHLIGPPRMKCVSMLCKSTSDLLPKFWLHRWQLYFPGSMSSRPSWCAIFWCKDIDSRVLYCLPQSSEVHRK